MVNTWYLFNHDVNSSCALLTDPETVKVNVPAVGVISSQTLFSVPVPTRVPVAVPDKVTEPVPQNDKQTHS